MYRKIEQEHKLFESLIQQLGSRTMETPEGPFDARVFKDRTGGVHLALSLGQWAPTDEVLVRVHEPLSVLDWLDAGSRSHSWPLPKALAAVKEAGQGVVILLNAGDENRALRQRAFYFDKLDGRLHLESPL